MSTDLKATFGDYYLSVAQEEWFMQFNQQEVDALMSIRITPQGFGACDNCGKGQPLFSTHTMYKVREHLCEDCTRRSVRFEPHTEDAFEKLHRSEGTQSATTNMLFPANLIPEHDQKRELCLCNRIIMQEGDHGILDYHAQTLQVMHEGEARTVHRTCTYNCGECECHKFGRQHAYFDGRPTCEPCSQTLLDTEDYSHCDYCRELFSDLHYSDARDRSLCTDCYHEPWDCGECYESRTENDDHECYRNGLIYDYSYKPSPEFYGRANYYFGFELEVEDANEHGVDDGAQTVIDHLGERVYCKHDGSLNDGFEIVSHPHSFDELENLNWDWLTSLRRLGFRSWDTTTCGLHVHISRTAFWKDGKRNEGHELRFQKLIYDNARMVEAIAGRSSSYARFKDKGYLVPKIKHGHQADRYEAVNSYNDATLEVRVFRGSLKKQRILSAIEFLHAATEYTRDMRINPKDKQLSWFRFMAYVLDNQDKYGNFTQVAMKALENTSVGSNSTDEDN